VKNKLIAIALCALLSVLTAACKQGRGERCQVNSDCESPLLCSNAEPKTCVGTIDGDDIPIDAPPPPSDTAVPSIDAAPDGP
jgi:hypothetical protein